MVLCTPSRLSFILRRRRRLCFSRAFVCIQVGAISCGDSAPVIVIVYRQFQIFLSHQYSFDCLAHACAGLNGDEIIRQLGYISGEVEREREGREKLMLSFRVSRCQGVMFYLKENNLRY